MRLGTYLDKSIEISLDLAGAVRTLVGEPAVHLNQRSTSADLIIGVLPRPNSWKTPNSTSRFQFPPAPSMDRTKHI
jgi:hypothetical protein